MLMNNKIKEAASLSFGGLNNAYYFRHFIFGLIFPAVLITVMLSDGKPIPISMTALMVLNTFLYPYSRFVYEGVVNFLLGRTVFFVNATSMVITKIFTMLFCWGFAVFIAPVGLIYLYVKHKKALHKGT